MEAACATLSVTKASEANKDQRHHEVASMARAGQAMFEVANITYVTTKSAADAADPQQLQSATTMAAATREYLANTALEAFAALAEERSSSLASPRHRHQHWHGPAGKGTVPQLSLTPTKLGENRENKC